MHYIKTKRCSNDQDNEMGTLKVGCHNYIQVDKWSTEDIILSTQRETYSIGNGNTTVKKGQGKGKQALYLARQEQTNTTKSKGKLVEIQRSALH